MSEMVKFNCWVFKEGNRDEIFFIIENKKLNIRHLISYPNHQSIFLAIDDWLEVVQNNQIIPLYRTYNVINNFFIHN